MRLRDSQDVFVGSKVYSVEEDQATGTFRVIFTDHTGIYQSYENSNAMIFKEKEKADKNANRFNKLYGK